MKVLKDISPEQREKVRALQAELDHHRRALDGINYILDKEAFFERMNRFWKFISSYEDEETFAYFQHSDYYQKNKNLFASMELYYVRTLGTVEAFNIMRKSLGKDQTFLDLFDRQLAKETYLQTNKDITLIDWQGKKKIVMVGSGPLPETILYLYDHTNIEQIVGLDNNQEAIFIAGEMIRSIKNTSRIQLQHYNGLHYDYSDADIIYVANFITPKIKILDRIAVTAKNGVQVLVQTPVSFGKMLYESATDGLNPRLTLTQEGAINTYFLSKTLVLQKFNI